MNMISVDWLTVSCNSMNPIETPGNIFESKKGHAFMWSEVNKTAGWFRHHFRVELISDQGEACTFARVFTCPNQEGWNSCTCHIKIENQMFYTLGSGHWVDLLQEFCEAYQITLHHIVRCDLACDFIKLQGQFSGKQIVKKLETEKWWKVGANKGCVYFRHSYTINDFDAENVCAEKISLFLNQGEVERRVESLTYGSMRSGAQVQLYNKSLELKRSEIEVSVNDQKVKESAKEYIRDCWKQCGCWSPSRDTWRLEIRLSTDALFISEGKDTKLRGVSLLDLNETNLKYTFFAATERYFKLLDVESAVKDNFTPEKIRSLKYHKNRLERVKLFDVKNLSFSLVKKKPHAPANAFNRAVIKRLSQVREKAKSAESFDYDRDPKILLAMGMKALRDIAETQEDLRESTMGAIKALEKVALDMKLSKKYFDTGQLQTLDDTLDMMKARLKTEAPRFTLSVRKQLKDVQFRISKNDRNELAGKVFNPYRFEQSAILREAADIMESIHSETKLQQLKSDVSSYFLSQIEPCLAHIMLGGIVPGWMFMRVKFAFSEMSPFNAETRAELRNKYYSKEIWRIMKCATYDEYMGVTHEDVG